MKQFHLGPSLSNNYFMYKLALMHIITSSKQQIDETVSNIAFTMCKVPHIKVIINKLTMHLTLHESKKETKPKWYNKQKNNQKNLKIY